MSFVRVSLGLVIAALGCGVHRGGPEGTRGAVEVEPARQSCRSTVAPSRHAFSHVGPVAQFAGRSYATAWRTIDGEVERVVVALDAAGALVVTPIPVAYADPLALGADAEGLLVISVPRQGTGSLLRIAVTADGLRPGPPTPLDIGWGWPVAIVSDGKQALVHHTLATPEQTQGAQVIYTVDLAGPRVVEASSITPGGRVFCHEGQCVTLEVVPASAAAPGRARLVRGRSRLDVEVKSGCLAFYEIAADDGLVLVAPGDPWQALESAREEPFLRQVAVDPGLPPEPGCARSLELFPSTARPGLINGAGTQRELWRWDGERFGAHEQLPAQFFGSSVMHGHADGVIEVGWTGSTGMMHTPTDAQGRRRYYSTWQFDGGEMRLLRYVHGAWRADDIVALALAPVDGTMGAGYQPVVLRHGLHAAVLLAAQGGAEALLQPYLAPCR